MNRNQWIGMIFFATSVVVGAIAAATTPEFGLGGALTIVAGGLMVIGVVIFYTRPQ